MTNTAALKAGFSVLLFLLGNLQAWDSNVPQAGLLVFFLVSLAIALPPVALLSPIYQTYLPGTFGASFILLLIARLISPIALPGLFITLVPAVMGLICMGLVRQESQKAR